MEHLNKAIYRYTVLVAASVLALIAIGAYVTSRAASPQMDGHGLLRATVHSGAAVIVGFMALFSALRQPWWETAVVAWLSVALFALEGAIGWMGTRLMHATLAPLIFSGMVAVLVVASKGWIEPAEPVDQQTVPLLRILAFTCPPLILLQTLLGAGYRHKLTGVLPHLAGAMVVALVALIASTLVLNRCPGHGVLRSAAKWLMGMVLAQVTLGAAAFGMQLLGLASTRVLAITTASHVVVGSLTMSASVVFAMQVSRHVRGASRSSLAAPAVP